MNLETKSAEPSAFLPNLQPQNIPPHVYPNHLPPNLSKRPPHLPPIYTQFPPHVSQKGPKQPPRPRGLPRSRAPRARGFGGWNRIWGPVQIAASRAAPGGQAVHLPCRGANDSNRSNPNGAETKPQPNGQGTKGRHIGPRSQKTPRGVSFFVFPFFLGGTRGPMFLWFNGKPKGKLCTPLARSDLTELDLGKFARNQWETALIVVLHFLPSHRPNAHLCVLLAIVLVALTHLVWLGASF